MAISKPDEKADETKSKIKIRTTEIPVDDTSTDETESMQVAFEDEDDANSFAAQQTKPSQATVEIDPNTSIDKIQEDVARYESNKSGKMEYKDLYNQAKFLITILDTSLSTVFKVIAKGKHAKDYEMPEGNKKLLTEQLTLILSKYQSKFKVEYMFFVGLLALYVPMAHGAVQNRKEVNAANKKPKEKIEERKPTEQFYRHEEGKQPEPLPEKKAEEPLKKVEVPGEKPKRGRRSKAF